MNAIHFTNGRGEAARFNGRDAWCGEDDDTSRVVNALQPVETVFPPCAPSERDARVHMVACDCLAGRAPRLNPEDDEREAFRSVWDACAAMRRDEFARVDVFDVAFSKELGVFARDVAVGYKCEHAFAIVFADEVANGVDDMSGTPFAIFTQRRDTFAMPISYLAGMQMAVLAAGGYVREPFGRPCVVAADGRRRELPDHASDAALMIALRARTPWHKRWTANFPF